MASKVFDSTLVALCFLILAWMPQAQASHLTLRVGVYPNPPKIFQDESGALSGILGDLLQQIAVEEHWRIEPVACEWDDCLQALIAGELDLLPDVASTPSRQNQMRFGQQSALLSWSQVFRHQHLDLDSLLDLQGRRIAVLQSSVQWEVLRGLSNDFNLDVEFLPFMRLEDAAAAVAKGEADALASNHFFGGYYAQVYDLYPTSIVFLPSRLYFVAPLTADPLPLTRIDHWLETWRKDQNSYYYQTLKKWQQLHLHPAVPTSFWLGVLFLLLIVILALFLIKHLRFKVQRSQQALLASDQERTRLVFYDSLTQLPNRRLLLERLQHSMLMATRTQSNGVLILIDIDNFHSLNDTLGHDLGDELLVQISRRLESKLRATDTLSRFGGDEFVLLIELLEGDEAQQLHQVNRVLAHKLVQFQQAFQLSSGPYRATASCGVAFFKDAPGNPLELLKCAELAVYEAKQTGRHQVCYYNHRLQEQAHKRAELEEGIRLALEQQAFRLVYQPQFDQQSQLLGVEALIRWQRGEELVSPAEFIPIAESSGLIVPLGYWILTQACQQLASWAQQPATAALRIAVNISARQLQDAQFVDQVRRILLASSAPAQQLELELTESLLLQDLPVSRSKMQQLRELGIRISLDDFGTGFSSLHQLVHLPLDQLKIDQSFVAPLGQDTKAAAVVQTILDLGDNLSLEVIAEGVETEVQYQTLLKMGCEQFQGYYLARPMSLEALEPLLQALKIQDTDR